ncbi:MAG TPA: hypothetical protein VME63_04655 [Dyella sp.]|uniref:hypothetical protein n=1 Tax=Dyella sp. TaxID=1869338 RepID=UPI002CBA992C|nr:hypothetical protein [Dyella sp.]HTV84669.1 hypothetical protein [Dyella sp.]
MLALGVKKPYYNWDMIGYVAAALSADGHRGADLNTAAYGMVKSEVGAPTFDRLVQQDDYRRTVYRDPVSLQQQLPFYRIRVLYVGLIRLMHAAGVNDAKSTYLISAVFAALSVVWLALIGRETGTPIAALPLVVAFSGLLDVARLSTPDAMACFFALLSVYALIRQSVLVFVVAAILPLVRTEFLLLSLLIFAHAFIYGKRKYALMAAAVSCALYWIVMKASGNDGWLVLFNFSLIHKTAYPAQRIVSHDLIDYLRPYVLIAYDLTTQPLLVLCGLAMAVLLMHGRGRTAAQWRLSSAVYVIPIAFAAMHLALFPEMTYRFFPFVTAVVPMGLLGNRQPGLLGPSRHDLR